MCCVTGAEALPRFARKTNKPICASAKTRVSVAICLPVTQLKLATWPKPSSAGNSRHSTARRPQVRTLHVASRASGTGPVVAMHSTALFEVELVAVAVAALLVLVLVLVAVAVAVAVLRKLVWSLCLPRHKFESQPKLARPSRCVECLALFVFVGRSGRDKQCAGRGACRRT